MSAPPISVGDYVAGGMFLITASGLVVREWRASVATKAREAADSTLLQGLIAKIDELFKGQRRLDEERQKHELECARIQERNTAAQERILQTLDRHDRSIVSVTAQMSHVMSGGAGRMREILPPERA